MSAIRQRGVSGIIPNNAKGSKVVRARAVASYVEAGDVWLNGHGPWLGLFLEEVSGFPQAAHDDQVDAMSQALAKMHKLGIRRSRTYADELQSTTATSVGGPNR